MIKIEVNEGKVPWVVGIGTILFGIFLGVLAVLYSKESVTVMVITYLVIVLIVGAGIWMCMDGRNRKLTVEDEALCYSNWFGGKKSFSLDEIGYCQTALEQNGSKDYLKLYDLRGEKLCKLEYNMLDSALFLQYLLDNHVRIECSEKSDYLLKSMINMTTVCPEEIPAVVNAVFSQAKELVWNWVKENKNLDAEWKMGIVTYLSEQMSEKKQLWEQEGIPDKLTENTPDGLPEGYLVAIEGYLQKDGQFVIDKKNRAVAFYVPVISVSKSLQVGEELIIRYFQNSLEELSEQLAVLAHILPRNRYHTEMLSLKHELKEMIQKR